jgi:hypothetical protein
MKFRISKKWGISSLAQRILASQKKSLLFSYFNVFFACHRCWSVGTQYNLCESSSVWKFVSDAQVHVFDGVCTLTLQESVTPHLAGSLTLWWSSGVDNAGSEQHMSGHLGLRQLDDFLTLPWGKAAGEFGNSRVSYAWLSHCLIQGQQYFFYWSSALEDTLIQRFTQVSLIRL